MGKDKKDKPNNIPTPVKDKRDYSNMRYYAWLYLQESWQLITRNKFLSIFTGATIFVLLLMAYTLISLNSHLSQVLSQANGNVLITAVLDKDADQANVMTNVNKVNGVNNVKFVSQEETKNRFLENTKFPAGSVPDTSIFPRVLEIQTTNTKVLKNVSEQIKTINGVQNVTYLGSLIETITNTTQSLRKIALFTVIFFSLLAVGLLVAVVRVSIHAKKENVEIMSLIGASKTTIMIPLLLQVLIIAIIAGTLACIVGYFVDPNLGVTSGSFLAGNESDLPTWLETGRAYGFMTLWPVIVPGFCLIASLITVYSVNKYIKDKE